MKKLLVLLVFILFMSPVFAANWQCISPKEYIDTDSIIYHKKYNDNTITFWLKELNDKSSYFQELEKINKSKVWYTMYLYEINCNSKKIHYNYFLVYGLKGEILYSDSVSSYWSDIVPDSKGEFYYKLICK